MSTLVTVNAGASDWAAAVAANPRHITVARAMTSVLRDMLILLMVWFPRYPRPRMMPQSRREQGNSGPGFVLAGWLLLAGCSAGVVVEPEPLPPTLDVAFSVAPGTFAEPFDLSLACGRSGAVIHYTLDGELPDGDSPAYGAPLAIEESTRVRALALDGQAAGPVVSGGWLRLDDDLAGFSTDLSLVILDSFGHDIDAESGSEEDRPEWPRRPVQAVIVQGADDARAAVDGAPDFVGRTGVKVRGNSSQILPKKQYSLEVWDEADDDRDVPLLGMPAESDWVLHAPYGDRSLMRNHLAYRWSNELGYRAARTRFVEVFFNQDDGRVSMDDYRGVYLVVEKHKRGEERIDVARLAPDAVDEPGISGGYILKIDVVDQDEEPFQTAAGTPPYFPWIGFLHVYPRADEISDTQQDWIRDYLDRFEAALYGDDFDDPDAGYAAHADADSFVHYHLLTEALKNADSYYASQYLHKELEGPLRMGPIWDWNVSFGGTSDWAVYEPEGWLYRDVDAYWFSRLVEDPSYVEAWTDRWHELRGDELATARLLADIADTAARLDEAQARNFTRWPILGEPIDELPHLNYPGWDDRPTYADEVAYLEDWLTRRLDWIDENVATLAD